MKVWEIIRVIEESPVAVESSDGLNVVFRTPNGYLFSVFFDCDDPDYVNWIQPAGEDRIWFWPDGDTRDGHKHVHAAAYLAGNLIHLPHVAERLKLALVRHHK